MTDTKNEEARKQVDVCIDEVNALIEKHNCGMEAVTIIVGAKVSSQVRIYKKEEPKDEPEKETKNKDGDK